MPQSTHEAPVPTVTKPAHGDGTIADDQPDGAELLTAVRDFYADPAHPVQQRRRLSSELLFLIADDFCR